MSLKGRKNAYYCGECKGYVVTIDLDEGVTPSHLACRVLGEPGDPANTCEGTMMSLFYPEEPWPAKDGFGVEIPTVPTWEWYRPTDDEVATMNPEGREHVRMGGLELRKASS